MASQSLGARVWQAIELDSAAVAFLSRRNLGGLSYDPLFGKLGEIA
jgi:hypothetical protein